MKTLVIIGYVWPEPKSSAAGSRMLQLIELFTKHVERIIFACPAELSEHALDLSSIQVELQHIALNCSSFDDWLASVDPQWVMFDRFMMEEQFGWRAEQTCPDALRILDMEDVHSLRHARHHAVKQGRELQPEDWFNEQTFREIASILRCDVTFVISEAEMTWLGEHFPIPASHLCYVPFMVSDKTPAIETETPAIETETPALRASLPTFEQRQHFLAIGNFRHAPNWDSVLELKRLWPDIRQQLQKQGINGVELHICGAYPPPKATQLHQPKDGFLIKGWIDDAQQTLANARVLLAPLRFG
ncbi:MAG: glycosyltransferase family 4 protein, partial [Oleibacter sp.]|nr:glycosyltransferase family 4 protein [Thalassolituus sp.]